MLAGASLVLDGGSQGMSVLIFPSFALQPRILFVMLLLLWLAGLLLLISEQQLAYEFNFGTCLAGARTGWPDNTEVRAWFDLTSGGALCFHHVSVPERSNHPADCFAPSIPPTVHIKCDHQTCIVGEDWMNCRPNELFHLCHPHAFRHLHGERRSRFVLGLHQPRRRGHR